MQRQLRFLHPRTVFILLCAITCVHSLRAESYEPLGLETLPLSLIHVADYAPLAGNSVAQSKAPPSSTMQQFNSAPQSTATLAQAVAEKSVADSFYLLGDAGVAFTQTMNITNHTHTATTGSLIGAKLNLNIGARFDIGVGYQLSDSFALELASGLIWNSVSSVEGNVLGSTGGFVREPLALQGGQGNIYNVPFMLNGKFRVPLNKDKTHPLSLTCGAGIGGIWSDVSVNNITSAKATVIVPNSALSVNGNSFAFAYQANLGLEWQLANHLYLGFGYAFLGTTALDYGPASFKTNAVGNTFDSIQADAIYTHSLLGTLRYEF